MDMVGRVFDQYRRHSPLFFFFGFKTVSLYYIVRGIATVTVASLVMVVDYGAEVLVYARKIVWATSTPLRVAEKTAKAKAHNEAAQCVLARLGGGVETDDLSETASPQSA